MYFFQPIQITTNFCIIRALKIFFLYIGSLNLKMEKSKNVKKCVFAQTPEWLDSDSCQKCEQPFFWNFKQMWDSKKIGLRQVLYNPIPLYSFTSI